jgi:Ulp1 family protease
LGSAHDRHSEQEGRFYEGYSSTRYGEAQLILVKKFLKDEYALSKETARWNDKAWSFEMAVNTDDTPAPKQTDAYNCGVFVSMFIHYFLADKNIDFIEADMPAFRTYMVAVICGHVELN